MAESPTQLDPPPTVPPPRAYDPLSFPVLTILLPTSVFGVLARLGLLSLGTYDAESVFPLAWVQGIGCLVMGLCFGLREPIVAFYGPLYSGLTTGFCGSLTTFSSWQLDVFLAWLPHRLWIDNVMDGLTRTLVTLAVSVAAFQFGLHLSTLIKFRLSKEPPAAIRHSLPVISTLTYLATIPCYFLVSPSYRSLATSALLFSAPGTIIRHLLAVNLNFRIKHFPLGTLLANSIATALLGGFYVLQRNGHVQSVNGCVMLQGLMDGLCGTMSTVSSFVAEMHGLSGKKAWIYVGISWVIGQLLMVVIVGSAVWTGHVNISEDGRCQFS